MQLKLQERLQSLRLLASLATFLKNPGSLDSVFAVANSVKDSPLAEQMKRHLLIHPQFSALVKEGWRPKAIDLTELQKLPDGTLGRCYADQLISQGITPDALIDPSPVSNDAEYITHRLRETHDIIHVLTGFGIDGDSELGLQGFNLAQTRSPLAVMLIFGGMLAALQDDEPLAPMLRAMARGFQLGLDADLVIAHKLEEGWDRPLQDWRQELRLAVISGT
ncbi:Coq4 family protein [Synechococcus sp. A15-60]|uniref:Coq4 family protein n=1 Tax=Synechococcus sp. A15-60 TaxID=1050655 RepID=UPI0016473173|nr:Coq4 family protein [Synechococcus sp. A15-60]QNI49508.1 plastoquinone biosynthesis coenzyme/ Coq4 family protein [Synechococcus sp. A15-60]